MDGTGRLETVALRGAAALLTVMLLIPLFDARSRPAHAQEEPDKESGQLVVTVLDGTSTPRGGACALVVDAAGVEQTVCDEDGDGTLVADGLAAGLASVKPLQPAAGCASAFGGEAEVPAGGEAALVLTDACEPLQPVEEKPTEDAKPTEEPQATDEATPTEDAKATEPPIFEPTETAVDEPTSEPTDAPLDTPKGTPPAATPTPTPAAGPSATGTLLIALSSTSFGRPSLGACYEVQDQATGATLATACDTDDGTQDGLTTVAGLPPEEIVAVQVSGDRSDNPAESQAIKIRAGKATSLALATQPLSNIDVVPLDADGQRWTAGVCFELRRHGASGPVAVACVGADGVARFPNMPQGGWDLGEWSLPTDHELAAPQFLTVVPGVSQTITVPHQRYRGGVTLHLVAWEGWDSATRGSLDELVLGGCIEYAPLSVEPFTAAALVVRCDGDDGSLDGRVVLSGLPADRYWIDGYDGYGPIVYNDRVYDAWYCGGDTPLEIRRDLPNATEQCFFFWLEASLFIASVDAATGQGIGGACYEVSRLAPNGGRTLVAAACDPHGWGVHLYLDRQGVYIITVTQAPNGYGSTGEQSINVVMQVPKTSGSASYGVTFRLRRFPVFGIP